MNGKAAARCTIFIGHSLGNGIGFSYSETTESNSYNENLTVDSDDQSLFLRAMGFDQEDIIRTVAEFGGRVTRTYVLSVAGTGKEPTHVVAAGEYSEEAFQSLDRVLALANQYDVKVIIPFIDTWEWWGGIPQFSAMHGMSADEFYTSEVTRAAYKDLVAYTIGRVNSVTGVAYRDDPARLPSGARDMRQR